jgi:hypothetical protein
MHRSLPRFGVVEAVMPKLEQRDIIGKHINGRESSRDPVVHSVSSTFISHFRVRWYAEADNTSNMDHIA